MWAKGYRNFRHANQETNNAIESYHCFLKTRFLNDRRRKCARRMDWFIYTLLKRVELYYWNIARQKKAGFANNYKLEHMLETSMEKAKIIPDHHCILHADIQNSYWVQSQSSLKTYLVIYSDQGFSSCDCLWAMKGNFCKHVIKIGMLHGDINDSMDINHLAKFDVDIDITNSGSPIMQHDYDSVDDQNMSNARNETEEPIINEINNSDLGRCQEIFDRCNKKIQETMMQPPHSISKALLMEVLVDKFVVEMKNQCINDFEFKYNDNERTLKRKKSFLSPKKRSFQRQKRYPLLPDLNADVEQYESLNFPFTRKHKLVASMNTTPIQGHDNASKIISNADATQYNFPIADGACSKKKSLEEELEAMYAKKRSTTIAPGNICVII